MSARLILIRHAHRNTDEPMRDNGLSEKGHTQVRKLKHYFEDELKGESLRFFTSPRKRCQETVNPIAGVFHQAVETDERLTESAMNENYQTFVTKMDEFLDSFKYEAEGTWVACSHGDWIPMAVERLTGARIAIKKAGFVVIEWDRGECFLTGLVQKV